MPYCYALVNTSDGRTYVGYTVDPARRLRQHNGQISGGAWSTARSNRVTGLTGQPGCWRFIFVVTVEEGTSSPFTKNAALSLEWHLKRRRPTFKGGGRSGMRERGVALRLVCLQEALAHRKFARFAGRFVVFAAPDQLDAVWAALVGSWAEGCLGQGRVSWIVLPLESAEGSGGKLTLL